jgi:hypothetical protein
MPKVMLAGQGLTEVVRQLDDESVETRLPPSLRLNLRVAVVTICAYAEENINDLPTEMDVKYLGLMLRRDSKKGILVRY